MLAPTLEWHHTLRGRLATQKREKLLLPDQARGSEMVLARWGAILTALSCFNPIDFKDRLTVTNRMVFKLFLTCFGKPQGFHGFRVPASKMFE